MAAAGDLGGSCEAAASYRGATESKLSPNQHSNSGPKGKQQQGQAQA